MALPPPPMPPAGAALPPGGMMPPPGGPPAPDDTGASDADDNVVCTIVDNGDGTYTVYAGDEPDQDAGDTSEDDANAMGPSGDQPAAPGQPASSVGAVLKIAMDILNAAKSSSPAPGDAESNFTAGFGGPGAGAGSGAAPGGPPGP